MCYSQTGKMFFPIRRVCCWGWWICSFSLTQGKDSLAGSERWVHEELNLAPFPWKEGITTLGFSVLPCGRHRLKYYSWNIPADNWNATSEFMCEARCIVQPEMKPARQGGRARGGFSRRWEGPCWCLRGSGCNSALLQGWTMVVFVS